MTTMGEIIEAEVTRWNYPNAALSNEALRQWSENAAALSSSGKGPVEMLAEATKNWGRERK